MLVYLLVYSIRCCGALDECCAIDRAPAAVFFATLLQLGTCFGLQLAQPSAICSALLFCLCLAVARALVLRSTDAFFHGEQPVKIL